MPLPPLPCISATLRRANRAVSRLYDEQLQASGLRITQFTILQVLDKADSVVQGRLGEILALDSTTLTRSLKLMEKEGWIACAPGSDRRERYFTLTAKGRKQLESARASWKAAQAKMRKQLPQADWDAFLTMLDRVTEAALESSP